MVLGYSLPREVDHDTPLMLDTMQGAAMPRLLGKLGWRLGARGELSRTRCRSSPRPGTATCSLYWRGAPYTVAPDHDLGFSSRKCPYSAGECRWAHKWPDGAAKRAYEKKNKKKKRRRAGSDSE